MTTLGQDFTFLIVSLLLLGFGYYIYISNFASNKKYKCEDNQCVKATSDEDGVYTSDDCNNACGDDPSPPDDKNVCEGHENDDTTSAYPVTCDTTLGVCTTGQYMECEKMNHCTDGKCDQDLKKNPNYQSESDCEKNCQILATAYTCSSGKCEKVDNNTSFKWQDEYIWSSKHACEQAVASGLCKPNAEENACSNKKPTESGDGKCCGKVQLQNRYCSNNMSETACNNDSINANDGQNEHGQNKCCWVKKEEPCPNACFSFEKKSGTTTNTTSCTSGDKKNTGDVAEKCYGFKEFEQCRSNTNMSDNNINWHISRTTCCGWGPNNDGVRNPLGTDINLPSCKGTKIDGEGGTNGQNKCLQAKNGYSDLCGNSTNGCYFIGQKSEYVDSENLFYQCILDDKGFSSVYQCEGPSS